MKIITTEEHFMSSAVNHEYTKIKKRADSLSERKRFENLEEFVKSNETILDIGPIRLSFMDESGINMQIISYGNNSPMDLEPVVASYLCEQANNELADLIKFNPQRFAGLACLPAGDADLAAKELARCVKTLNFKGAILHGTYNGNFFDQSRFFNIFAKAAELDVPIYLHPGFINQSISDYYYKSNNWSDLVTSTFASFGLGWHYDCGVHLLRLILSGLFDKLPTLKILIGHWGELLPYYLDRIDEMLPQDNTKLDQKISAYFKRNIYITPSGLFDKLPAQLCLEAVGPDRIIWSTDYPYIMKKNTKDFLSGLEIPDNDKNKIAHLNAEKLFKL